MSYLLGEVQQLVVPVVPDVLLELFHQVMLLLVRFLTERMAADVQKKETQLDFLGEVQQVQVSYLLGEVQQLVVPVVPEVLLELFHQVMLLLVRFLTERDGR